MEKERCASDTTGGPPQADDVSAVSSSASPPSAPPSVDSITCDICQRVFYGNRSHGGLMSNFNRHLLTHSGDRPYGCEQCDMTFTTSSNLRRHVLKRHPPPLPQQPDVFNAAAVEEGAAASRRSSPVLGHPPDGRGSAARLAGNGATVSLGSGGAAAAVSPSAFACRIAGCDRTFTWKATRTVHEKACRGGGGAALRECQPSGGRDGNADAVGSAGADGADSWLASADAPPPPPPSTTASRGYRAASGGGATRRGHNNDNDDDVDDDAPPIHLHRHTVECPDCEAVLASRSKLRRHQAFHCPFRCDDAVGPADDVYTPLSAGAPVFPRDDGAVTADRCNADSEVGGTQWPMASPLSQSDNAAHRRRRPLLPCPHCEGLFRNHRLLRAHMSRRHPTALATTAMAADDDGDGANDVVMCGDDGEADALKYGARKRARCDHAAAIERGGGEGALAQLPPVPPLTCAPPAACLPQPPAATVAASTLISPPAVLDDFWSRVVVSSSIAPQHHRKRSVAGTLPQQPHSSNTTPRTQLSDDEPYLELCVSDVEGGGGGNGFTGLASVL